jgi:hypothetical protein
MEFERSRTAIQLTRALGLRSGRPSRKPGGADMFPDARDTFPGRYPDNPCAREAILGVGKANQPFGFVPEASGSLFFGPGALESRRGGIQRPRARKLGIRKAKAGTEMASREVLQVDQACLEHSTTPWARPWKASAARKGDGRLSVRQLQLGQEDSSPGPIRPGPQDNREPRSRRTWPLLRQAASKLTTRWLQG